MLLKLLSALEKNVKEHGCAVNDILYDFDETPCHECQGDCVECKKASLEQMIKLKQSLENKQGIKEETSETSSDKLRKTRQGLDNVNKREFNDEITYIEKALKKAKAIKPDVEGDGYCPEGKLVYDTWICPTCGSRYEIDYQDYDYCPKCGQHIDMSDIRSC